VLAAIEFHDQRCLQADEVHDIWPHGRLAAEFGATQAAIPQREPETTFDIGLPLAQS
jgi:hypothetical protein